MAEHVDEEIVLDSSRNVAKEMSDKTNKVRTCTRCGQATKGHDGPCGLRCTNVLASPESLRHAPEQWENMMLNLTPVKDTREEEEVPADSPAKAMEKIKFDKDGEKHITETDLSLKKADYPHPQKCCYEQCDLIFESKNVFAQHILKHMKQGD